MDISDERFFQQCPNCKQRFQGDIAYDLAKAQLSFVEREFKEVRVWRLRALMMWMFAIITRRDMADRIEGERICDEVITLIEDDMKSFLPSLDALTLFSTYQNIGYFKFDVGTTQSLKEAKHYLEKAIDVIKTSGDHKLQWNINPLENELAQVEARLNGDSMSNTQAAERDLYAKRLGYNHVRIHNGTDVRTIELGVMFATDLFHAFHTIEAQRVLDDLVVTARRVLGSSHEQTKNAVSVRKHLKLRGVFIDQQPYHVLRCENDGNIYVVNGPVPPNTNLLEEPRSWDDKKTFSIPSANTSFSFGSPVMLHGLKKAAHLNGEIGDIRKYCESTDRYVVHFEDKALKPVKVKHENVRMIFDLPDPKS